MFRLIKLAALWIFLFVSAVGLDPEPVRAEGFTPDEAVARMVMPDGFHAEVFACEPMIRQPLSVNFDDRGRAWVIEYLQYPTPAGLKPVTVDQYLRTEYDRVPEAPPKGPRGLDRITILEDTDGDGRADASKIFVDGLNLASGLAIGHGGVFVAQAPYLLFYPDRDKDDRPDGEPEVLLKGFGLQDAHATVNSLIWGPDGWLYGVQGSTVTARIRGIEFQQGVWRYHPRTRAFELFAEGGGNTWGLDFDASGNAFGSSNGSYIAFHTVQGGNYVKGFAKHGPLHNPFAFGYFGALAYDGPKVGGHVTPGGIIYKADAYPAAFQGVFIGGNLLSNTVYWHDLSPLGSTFKARHGGTLIDARDNWFRPIDLQVGPDGCVYVVDWYDRRASHLDPRDNWDKTNGRIYRVVYHDRQKLEKFDLARLSSQRLLEFRTSPNDWYAATGRRILDERRDPALIAPLKTLLAGDRDETLALRDLWMLNACGGFDDPMALTLLEHPVAGVRRWTVRLLGDEQRSSPSLLASLVQLAATEPDPRVRSQLASSCQRWKTAEALPILTQLMRSLDDRSDPQIPLLLWWAFERHLRDDSEAVVALFCRPESQTSPIVRETILPRLARWLTSRGTPADFAACAKLLAKAPGEGESTAIVNGMDEGLAGHPLASVPPEIAPQLAVLWDLPAHPPTLSLIRFAARLGSPEALVVANDRLNNPQTPAADRLALVDLLGQRARPDSLPILLDHAREGDPLAPAALRALGGYNDARVGSELIGRYPTFNPALRSAVLTVLASRPVWATTLLDAFDKKVIDPRNLTAAQALQIARLGDTSLATRLEAVWGRLPGPGSPEKIRRIAEVRGFFVEGDKGNAARGQPVFKEHCAVCHKLFNEGESIGPDLTGSERKNLDFLLQSLVDPSSQIRKEYQGQTIALRDGRVLGGLLADETGTTLTLIDSERRRTVLPRDQIESIRPSTTSVMPDGLLDRLPEGEVRDLIRYLQSDPPR